MITDKNEIRNKINATYKDANLRENFEVLVYWVVPLKKYSYYQNNQYSRRYQQPPKQFWLRDRSLQDVVHQTENSPRVTLWVSVN